MSTEQATPPKFYARFMEDHPAVAKAYGELGKAVRSDGPLTEREVALVKLGLAVGARMEGAVHAHVRKATAAGVEPKAIQQAVVLAIPTIGFPSTMAAYSWVQDALTKSE